MLGSFWRIAFSGARDSLRANLVPALLLQAVGVAIVVSYYGFSSTRALWDELARFKVERGGLLYAVVSTAFFAALLPFALSRLSRGARHEAARHLPWLLVFWGAIGVLVDGLYRFQAWLFGDNTRALTILLKVAFDEFVFSPLISLPLITLAYAWKDANYNRARMQRALGPRWFWTRAVPLMGAAWVVWIPAIALVYALPLALQLPIANLVQCLWSLLLLFLTKPAAAPQVLDEPRSA